MHGGSPTVTLRAEASGEIPNWTIGTYRKPHGQANEHDAPVTRCLSGGVLDPIADYICKVGFDLSTRRDQLIGWILNAKPPIHRDRRIRRRGVYAGDLEAAL
jgi:hypothetical protein